jgi:hypothetical protein
MNAGLRRFREPKPAVRAGERCEMCARPIQEPHSHVVNVETRSILCTCRPCYLLFTVAGAAHGKHRAVPERYRHLPDFALAERVWEAAGIPVSMMFVFVNSVQSSIAAFYPSPAGATESLLPTDAWTELLADNPTVADIAPDVEALLIRRQSAGFEAGFDCFLVPIDACYELVGLVRTHWKGFDGGTEAWEVIDGFFERLREQSEVVGAPIDG